MVTKVNKVPVSQRKGTNKSESNPKISEHTPRNRNVIQTVISYFLMSIEASSTDT